VNNKLVYFCRINTIRNERQDVLLSFPLPVANASIRNMHTITFEYTFNQPLSSLALSALSVLECMVLILDHKI
jgi:hypothetical protein